MNVAVIMRNIIFCYGVVFLNFALAILFIRKKRNIHWLGAAVLADFGLMCVGGAVSLSRHFGDFLANSCVFLCLVLLGPLGSRLIHECFGDRETARPLIRINHAVSLGVFAFGLVGAAIGLPWKYVYSAEYACLSFYLLNIALYEGHTLRPIRKMPTGLLWFYLIIWTDGGLTLLMCATRALDAFLPLYALWILQIFSILAITLIAFRAPETYRLIGVSAEKIKQSRLDPSFVESMSARLDALMRERQRYLDPDISLDGLAASLSVRPHQLSEMINIHLGQNFAAYVNSFRIARAKEMLVERADDSVLEIGFACGFNSKSVFNDAFRKATGVTPTEFRRVAAATAAVPQSPVSASPARAADAPARKPPAQARRP